MTAKPVVYCKRCVTPNTWPDAIFDAEGICLPCRYAESMGEIDWDARHHELMEISAWGRENSRSAYDCIIGVSGGKDSTRQACYARDVLGLRPLLVSCAYPPEQQTERGARNLANLSRLGFDIHMVGPSPAVSKQLMRHSFFRYGNLFRATELALYASLPRTALAFGIPLMMLGENPALQFGGSVGSLDGNANNQRTHNTLGGAELAPWLEAGVREGQLLPYRYPSEHELQRGNLRIIYLGYYMRDFNDLANTTFSKDYGLEPRMGLDAEPSETGSMNPYDALDDEFVHVNQYLKYLKLGFGKVTQQASVRLRLGDITREQAIEWVERYDGKCSQRFVDKLCTYLGASAQEFEAVADKLRNKDLWQLNNHGAWELRYPLRPKAVGPQ